MYLAKWPPVSCFRLCLVVVAVLLLVAAILLIFGVFLWGGRSKAESTHMMAVFLSEFAESEVQSTEEIGVMPNQRQM